MSCEITITNGRPSAKTHPGLMNEILAYTDGNLERSMDLYGVTLLDDFKALRIKNPGLENILSYIEAYHINNHSGLSRKDRVATTQLRLQSESRTDLKQQILEALTVDGRFGIDSKKIQESGLFSSKFLVALEGSLVNLKQLYYKLSDQSVPEFDSIQTDFLIEDSDGNKLNPDQVYGDLMLKYAGLDTREQILDLAEQTADSMILDNPGLVDKLLPSVQNSQKYPAYEIESGQLVRKTGSVANRIKQTLDPLQNFGPVLTQIEFLKALDPVQYQEESGLVQRYLRNIEIQLARLGLDTRGFSDSYSTHSYDQVQEYTDHLYNLLADLQNYDAQSTQESLENYAQAHSEFYGTQDSEIEQVAPRISGKGSYIHLETQESESDLYKNHGLVQVAPNIYRVVQNKTELSDLYDIALGVPEVVPKEVFSVRDTPMNRDIRRDDLDQFISEQSAQYITDDPEAAKKLAITKLLIQAPQTTKSAPEGDLDLDPVDFLTRFNKALIFNPDVQSLFYFSNRGLEARNPIGEYSAEYLRSVLPQSTFEDLVRYAKLSQNQSLEYLAGLQTEADSNLRDFYANNLDQLPEFKGEYYTESNYLVAKSGAEFLRLNNQLYEQLDTNIYGQVQTDSRYTNHNLRKPSYDGSIIPEFRSVEKTDPRVSKTTRAEDNNIEFC